MENVLQAGSMKNVLQAESTAGAHLPSLFTNRAGLGICLKGPSPNSPGPSKRRRKGGVTVRRGSERVAVTDSDLFEPPLA